MFRGRWGSSSRVLTESGDRVQLIHPDYGAAVDRESVETVRSFVLPFYKELHLPLPPFGSIHRAIDSFRPDIVHIATEATLGLSVLRFAMRRRLPVVSSFHTNFDQYSSHYGVGWARGVIWRYLRWFHNRTRETYVPSVDDDSRARRSGLRAPGTVEARRGQLAVSARSGRCVSKCVVRSAGRPMTW